MTPRSPQPFAFPANPEDSLELYSHSRGPSALDPSIHPLPELNMIPQLMSPTFFQPLDSTQTPLNLNGQEPL